MKLESCRMNMLVSAIVHRSFEPSNERMHRLAGALLGSPIEQGAAICPG